MFPIYEEENGVDLLNPLSSIPHKKACELLRDMSCLTLSVLVRTFQTLNHESRGSHSCALVSLLRRPRWLVLKAFTLNGGQAKIENTPIYPVNDLTLILSTKCVVQCIQLLFLHRKVWFPFVSRKFKPNAFDTTFTGARCTKAECLEHATDPPTALG